MNNSSSKNIPATKITDKEEISLNSDILELETTLNLSKYNCVVLQLQRSMIKIFGKLQQKFIIVKMRAFLKISESPSPIVDIVTARIQKTLSQKLLKIFNCKLINNKTNAFYLIQQSAAQNRKLRKYDLAEIDVNQTLDDDFVNKARQLERLTNKYHRLISQFSLLSTKVDRTKK